MILGKAFSGEEAAKLGMVTMAVAESEFEQSIAEMVNRLANAPKKAIGLMKKQIYEGLSLDHSNFMDFAAPLINEINIEDRKEGIAAILEK